MARVDPTERLKKLIETYRKAYQDVLYDITQRKAVGRAVEYQEAVLSDLSRLLDKLNEEAKAFASDVIPSEYRRAKVAVDKIAKAAGVNVTAGGAFGGVHDLAVNALVESTMASLVEANRYAMELVGRRVEGAYRDVQLAQAARKISTGSTLKEMQKRVIADLAEQGIDGFTDIRGRRWRLDTYSAMVTRSTTAEAYNSGVVNRTQELGLDLVRVSKHSTPCPVCAPLEGRVYSISGKHPDYPPLNRAFKSGRLNIHPNCGHNVSTYIPEMDDDAEATLEESNRSFDVDPRDEKTKRRYEAQQEELRRRRDDRRQWERYRARLGERAPKTFASFRSLKKRGGDAWARLERGYAEVGRADRAADAVRDKLASGGLEGAWKSPSSYRKHIAKRLRQGHVSSVAELEQRTLNTLNDHDVLVVEHNGDRVNYLYTNTSAGWSVAVEKDLIVTSYRRDVSLDKQLQGHKEKGWQYERYER